MMLVAQTHLLTAILALVALVNRSLAFAVPDADGLAVTPTSTSSVSAATSSASLLFALSALNTTVGGRVKRAIPFEAPCFSIVEGKSVPVDVAACKDIQSNYTDAFFRVSHSGAYMLVSRRLSFMPVILRREREGDSAQKMMPYMNEED